MKTQKLIAVATFVAIAGLTTGMAVAERWDSEKKGMPEKRARSFEASGVFTGVLRGEVEIGGRKIVISDDAAIYHVAGAGLGRASTAVAASYVHVSGLIKGEEYLATSVIVSEPRSKDDFSNVTQPDAVADPKRAR